MVIVLLVSGLHNLTRCTTLPGVVILKMTTIKSAYGPPSLHVLSSKGPSSGNLQFYSTTYSTNYKSGSEDRERDSGLPKPPLRHKGTGYTANFRPAIYYSTKQDLVDNPPMVRLLADNYDTCSKKEFIRHRVPDPNEPFPSHVTSGVSGFSQNQHTTLLTKREVNDVHVDTRLGGALPIYPRHQALLHTLGKYDPVSKENAGHGPKAMSTECNANFTEKPRNTATKSFHSRVEDSGYTQAYNNEPVTFRPFENHEGDVPGYMTWRPTGGSIMKRDFNRNIYMLGNEPIQSLSGRADLSNGYIKGNMASSTVQPRPTDKVGYTERDQVHPVKERQIKKDDPTEYSVLTNPSHYATLQSQHYQGRRRTSLTEGRSLMREGVGGIESTGYTENNVPFVELASQRDGARFYTHYQDRFPDPTLRGSARYGYASERGGVYPPDADGFTKSTLLHKLGSHVNTEKEVRELHPYAARSLTSRYPYMSDQTHRHKFRYST